jgi:hypothetical protein
MRRRLLKEPLVHFVVLGAVLFVLYALVNGRDDRPSGEIMVTQGRIVNLATTFARTWQRPPTQAELDGLIRDYVREEVYYREALAMGLDRDDTVVRRRLRQKLEFVAEDAGAAVEPTNEELRDYLAANPGKFRAEPRVSFTQVYLNPERRRDTLADDAARLLSQLRTTATDPAVLGDPSLLEQRFEDQPLSEVSGQFGDQFADRLAELPVGEWAGPVESGFGAHLVRVAARTDGSIPALDEVRDAVRREWQAARQREAAEKFYQSLLGRYTVTIEKPATTADAARSGP